MSVPGKALLAAVEAAGFGMPGSVRALSGMASIKVRRRTGRLRHRRRARCFSLWPEPDDLCADAVLRNPLVRRS